MSRWVRVRRADRCPVCDGTSWCSYAADGSVAACMRDSTGLEQTDASGQTYYLHVLDSSVPRRDGAGPDAMQHEDRAPVAMLDEAYRYVLASLSLSESHHRDLATRGLSDDEIRARQYRTLPIEGRGAIGKSVAARIGEASVRGVPGMRVGTDGTRSWWTLGGSAGLVVPVRNADGLVVALKVRADGETDGPRYTYVSSASKGGASAMLAVHVPTMRDDADCSEVRVTEGELKADVATALSLPTISIPGVGAWRLAAPVAKRLGASAVRVALDADHRTKPEVGEALCSLVRDLAACGMAVSIERWDSERGNGIDDVLRRYGTGAIRLVQGEAVSGYVEKIQESSRGIRRAREAMRLGG